MKKNKLPPKHKITFRSKKTGIEYYLHSTGWTTVVLSTLDDEHTFLVTQEKWAKDYDVIQNY